ncbi:unnamed protein product, partial [Brassica rapa subsp. narinosa]
EKPGHVKKNQTQRVLQDIPANHSSQGHKNPTQCSPFTFSSSRLPPPFTIICSCLQHSKSKDKNLLWTKWSKKNHHQLSTTE